MLLPNFPHHYAGNYINDILTGWQSSLSSMQHVSAKRSVHMKKEAKTTCNLFGLYEGYIGC